ncbi:MULTISPECIES: hypothetical protein [unclassified Prevotella]|uniref:hypothetical protein n=1 Tax=unclassified Prevotella TaxID=2638335 RepID=UPI00048E73C4|nr:MULTISPECIES: hypothetical protein [unclassified Prevotella]
MKKLLVAAMAIVALCACGNGEKQSLNYRGLSMGMPFKTFCDSLTARGFAIDSAHSDSDFTRVSMYNPNLNYRLMLAQKNDTLKALQENYYISTNDSTRKMWQQLHDEFEKQIGAWPNMLKDGKDHRIAKFEDKGGFITLTLENTYKPTLSVLYQLK